jgi:class 3 adenylate cyclase
MIKIPSSLVIHFTNLIAKNFSAEEIDLLGKYLEPRFNAHIVSGEPFGIMLKPEKAAGAIVKYFTDKGRLAELFILIFHTNKNASVVHRDFEIEGLEDFKNRLKEAGLVYDSGADRIVEKPKEDLDGWEGVNEGETYNFAILSIDIAGNSIIQTKYQSDEIEFVYKNLYALINECIRRYDGRIWSWAGDGGIAAFYKGEIAVNAVQCAMDIQTALISFNISTRRNLFHESIRLRVAAHMGPVLYKKNKGEMLSEAINYVAHLEKKGTDPGSVAVSKTVYDNLNPRLKKIFQFKGDFEGLDTYTVSLKMRWMDSLDA